MSSGVHGRRVKKRPDPYRIVVAVVEVFIGEEQRVSDEDEDGSQDERDEHLDVDVVPGAVQLPEHMRAQGQAGFSRGGASCDWLGDDCVSPELTEDGDGDDECDERERVAGGVHGLHVGEIQVGI